MQATATTAKDDDASQDLGSLAGWVLVAWA